MEFSSIRQDPCLFEGTGVSFLILDLETNPSSDIVENILEPQQSLNFPKDKTII